MEWALRLTRAGSVIVVDNVVRGGRVADAGSTEPDVVGTRNAIDLIANHPRLSGTAIQTVGQKATTVSPWPGTGLSAGAGRSVPSRAGFTLRGRNPR